MARNQTFGKNHSLIEFKYGIDHKQAFGENSGIPKNGDPDNGGGIYADALPYADWYKMASHMRALNVTTEFLPIALSSGVISMISYPGLTAFILIGYWTN